VAVQNSTNASWAIHTSPSSEPFSTNSEPGKIFSTIDSDSLNFDYNKNIAHFEGHVVAIDPQLKITCDKMIVYFTEKRKQVQRVEVFGNVHLFNEGKEGTAEKGVFTRDTGLITLTGDTPSLTDEKRNRVKSRGEGIVYNIISKQLHVDKPTVEGTTSEKNALNKIHSKINAETLNFDYVRQVATFEGQVIAEDPELKQTSDKMLVFFSEKDHQVLRIESYSNVRLFGDGKEALGEKAVYTREDQTISLSGGKQIMKDQSGNWIASRGTGIKYNLSTRQMHVDQGTTAIKPDSL
jgi:lipopolysaccharide transport protein LptA